MPRLRASMHLFWKHCLQLLTALSQFLAPLPRNATIWIKCWTGRRRTVTWFHFHICNRRWPFCPARSKPISVNSIVCQRPILVSVLTKIKLVYSKTCKLKENRSNGCLRLKPKSLTESIIPSTALLITTWTIQWNFWQFGHWPWLCQRSLPDSMGWTWNSR